MPSNFLVYNELVESLNCIQGGVARIPLCCRVNCNPDLHAQGGLIQSLKMARSLELLAY
jgi:hypothetical protein